MLGRREEDLGVENPDSEDHEPGGEVESEHFVGGNGDGNGATQAVFYLLPPVDPEERDSADHDHVKPHARDDQPNVAHGAPARVGEGVVDGEVAVQHDNRQVEQRGCAADEIDAGHEEAGEAAAAPREGVQVGRHPHRDGHQAHEQVRHGQAHQHQAGLVAQTLEDDDSGDYQYVAYHDEGNL